MKRAVTSEFGIKQQWCIVHGLHVALGRMITRHGTLTEQLEARALAMDVEDQEEDEIDAISGGEISVSTDSSDASTVDQPLRRRNAPEEREGNCEL